jgi:DNA-binding transcriptional ArsR family regulator
MSAHLLRVLAVLQHLQDYTSPGDICQIEQIPRRSVERILGALRMQGRLESRREGRRVYYRLRM